MAKVSEDFVIGQGVVTPLGKGRVAYRLTDGSLLVEFDWGAGQVFRPTQLCELVETLDTRRPAVRRVVAKHNRHLQRAG